MPKKITAPTLEEFTKLVIKYYRCNNFPEHLIEDIIVKRNDDIKKYYLIATPELIAIKMFKRYRW